MSIPKPEEVDKTRLEALAQAVGLDTVLKDYRADLQAALLLVEKCRRDLALTPLEADEDPWPPMQPAGE